MNDLTVIERRDLQRLETQIENGLKTFLQVGLALKEIRDLGLYKEFGTFEQYVSKRWELSSRRAYQFIDAVDVAENLGNQNVNHGSQTPTNERQYRELAKLEPEKIPEVWQAVTKNCEETGEQPTAKKIKAIAAEIVEPFEYVEVDESEIEPGDIDCGPVDWKPVHRKAIATCEALMRAIGDLNELKSSEAKQHCIKWCDDIWEALKSW
jgi:hypothetical protein